MKIKVSNVNTPNWKEVTVKSRIPEELEKVVQIMPVFGGHDCEATDLLGVTIRFGKNVDRIQYCCWNV